MADVSAIPFINFGLSQAQQAQAGASANLQNQQALAAQQQNQLMAAKMPVMMAAYKEAQSHITDTSGQTNGHQITLPDYDPASDNSGTAPPNSNANVRVNPMELIGRAGDQTNVVQGAVQGKYTVDPAGTPQQQAKIQQAADWSSRAHMIDPELGASADKLLDQAKYEKDQDVLSKNTAARLDSSKYYETLANVNSADHPFTQLSASGPDGAAAAARLKAQNPNATDDQLDVLAESATGQAAAFIHRFTGRKTVKGDDGIYRDEDTQQPVPHTVPAGFKPEDIAKLRTDALTPSTRTDTNGRSVTKKNYEWAGFDNEDQYVAAGVAQARMMQASQNKVEQKRQQAVVIQAHAGVPPEQRIPPPGAKPGAVVSSIDAANTPAAQGAAANHQFTKPPGTPPPPTTVVPPPKSPTAPAGGALASTNSPTGKLDMSDIQKSSTPNQPGALPQGTAASDADTAYWGELRKKNAEVGQTAQGANTAIQIATNAQNALKADAATGGTAHMRQALATALGNPESLRFILGDATSSAILRKMLGNAAFEQLETDANGNSMRLGSQTIRVAMTQLSASPEMTPDAIKALTGQMIKNASYEKQKGVDYGRYRAAGGDVTDFDRWYGSKYPNKTTIDTGEQKGPPTISNQKDYDALPKGAAYVDANGKPHHKGGQ